MAGKLYLGILLVLASLGAGSSFGAEPENREAPAPAVSQNESGESKDQSAPKSASQNKPEKEGSLPICHCCCCCFGTSQSDPEKSGQNPAETEAAKLEESKNPEPPANPVETGAASPSPAANPEESTKTEKPTKKAEDETAPKPSGFAQYDLKAASAKYRIEGSLITEFARKLNVSGSLNCVIEYSLRPAKERKDEWDLTIKVTDGAKSIITYLVKMDQRANVLEEKGTFYEHVDAQPTFLQRIAGKEPASETKKSVEHLTVSIEDKPLLGRSKVIRMLQRRSGNPSEMMVAPEDTITTLAQIVVWIGSIKALPESGVKLRWTADGKPFPFILREGREANQRLLQLHRDDPTLPKEQKDMSIVQFVLERNPSGFTYPERIVLNINNAKIEIVKQASK